VALVAREVQQEEALANAPATPEGEELGFAEVPAPLQAGELMDAVVKRPSACDGQNLSGKKYLVS
jgi:hypothetical protein